VGRIFQRLEKANTAYLMGKGKLEELKARRASEPYDLVVFDNELTPSQQRNLEQCLQVKVLDRSALILDIFATRARSKEGKLQVEMAQLMYLLPRLSNLWVEFSRLGGGIGTRGPGETQLEVDRRLIRSRINHLRAQLKEVQAHRELYRTRRMANGIPVVAIIGYTNSGKSTLLNALANAGVLAEDKLFATLDPTTRRVRLPNNLEVLFTDTVGFIRHLPESLVTAFRATLEEVEAADVLLHVVDVSHPNRDRQVRAVAQTLHDLHISEKPIVTALNKVDLLEGLAPNLSDYPHAVLISARDGYGLDTLLAKVAEVLAGQMEMDVRVRIPYEQGRLVDLFHQKGVIRKERHEAKGTLIEGTLPRKYWPLLRPYAVQRISHLINRG